MGQAKARIAPTSVQLPHLLSIDMPAAPSPSDLLRRMTQGDAAALEELYDTFAGRVNAVALAVCGEGQLAEEAVQDVFVKVWRNPEAYRFDDGRFVSWLMTLARRCALDRLRRERVRVGVTLGDSVTLDDDDNPIDLPDASQADESRWREMRLVMAALPADQRDALELAFYRGMSQSEISDYTGVPLGTIKSRIRMGMDRLRGLLTVAAAILIAGLGWGYGWF